MLEKADGAVKNGQSRDTGNPFKAQKVNPGDT